MKGFKSFVLSTIFPFYVVLSFEQAYAEGGKNSLTTFGTFESPGITVKPKFRYWLPDASVDPNYVAADVKSIGSIGAGGIEFLPYYNYGGSYGIQVTDWNIYGFGTPAYNRVLKSAAQATKDSGLIMDLAMGAQSGQGAPADPKNPGLAYDLITIATRIAPGATFKGTVPGLGTGTLVSVSSAMVVDKANYSIPQQNLAGTVFFNYTLNKISETSLTDITSAVQKDGTISVTFPKNSSAIEYIVYAAYYKLSGNRACTPAAHPTSIIGNGSFAVDHFSIDGAKVTTDFLEKYVLINGVKELMEDIGNYIWEDSVEIKSPVFWTPKFAATFKKMHGYDVGKYVMLLSNDNDYSDPATSRFTFEQPERAQGYIDDYRETLTYLMSTYYQHLVDWSHKYLGLEFSGQVGYNLPVDMGRLIPVVNAPEDESLGFWNTIDSYRQVSGPANLAAKRVISNELGAVPLQAYQQTLPAITTLVHKAWSGGNNQMVFHAGSYSFQYPNTTWPGFAAFGYIFSEMHSRHQPAWENGYADVMGYVARTQWVLQIGSPKRDFATWNKDTRKNMTISINQEITPPFNATDLIDAGYNFDYLSPANFELSTAIVSHGVLAENGPSYKALLIKSTDYLTVAGTARVVQYAKQGLPVIIAGGIPTRIASAYGLVEARANLKSILKLKNVHQITASGIASSLAALGIEPLTKIETNGTWYTSWRHDASSQIDYIFIYNDGSYSEGTIEFRATGQPFYLNSWTGKEEPVLNYVVSSTTTTIPFKFAASQGTIVAFKPYKQGIRAKSIHITSAPSSVLGFSSKNSGLFAKVPALPSPISVLLSSGKKVNIPVQKVTKSYSLSNWTLVVEKWGPPANIFDSGSLGVKTNTTYNLKSLESWPTISGVANTSGVGYYSTIFSWDNKATGAIIDFGRVVHSLRVRVNGKPLPPLDYTSPKADISAYLVTGNNKIEAIVASTLFNGMVDVYSQLMSSGASPMLPAAVLPKSVEAGLVTPVIITPYIDVAVA